MMSKVETSVMSPACESLKLAHLAQSVDSSNASLLKKNSSDLNYSLPDDDTHPLCSLCRLTTTYHALSKDTLEERMAGNMKRSLGHPFAT